MLGDRSLFDVERPEARAVHLDVERAADALDTVDAVMRRHDGVLAQLERERDRINGEAIRLNLFGRGEEAGSVAALLDAIDNHVGGAVPRMEARISAAEGTPEALILARRLLEATERILTAVGGVSPVDDLLDNVTTTTREATKDLGRASAGVSAVVVVALVVVGALWLRGAL